MPAEIVEVERERAGRPELYPTVVLPNWDMIFEAISQGYTEKSIYEKLGINRQSWIDYKAKYTEFAEMIIRARSAAGELLLNKQFQAGCGQKVTLRKQKALKDGSVVDIEEEMYIPPNVNAADFWGRHMMPEYKAPKSVESGGNLTVNFQLPQIQSELQKLAEQEKILQMQLNQGVYEFKE
jgi:hypothetical protein